MSIQTKETIEFSRHGGIKITYLRFLADSAPGFLFILVCVFLYYYLKYLEHPEFHIPPIIIDEKVKIGILILLLLLATPLGLAINAISWIFLGRLEQFFARFFIKLEGKWNILAGSSRYEYAFDSYSELYFPKINTTSPSTNDLCKLYEYSKQYEILLSIYFPAYHTDTGHISGLTQFTRSIAFIALCFGVFFYVITINPAEYTSNLNYSATFLIASPIIFISLFFLIIILINFIFKLICCFWSCNKNKIKKCPNVKHPNPPVDNGTHQEGNHMQDGSCRTPIKTESCFNFLDSCKIILLFLIGIGISIAVLYCISAGVKGPMVLVCIFLSIFFLFIVTAGFVEFYTSIKVLAYVHALTDPSHRWKSQDDVECHLKEITEYLIREGKK